MRSFGPLLILFGVAAIVIGALAWAGWLSWFGRLPGDIRVEREGFHLFVPITSMILVSLVLTILLNLVRRLF